MWKSSWLIMEDGSTSKTCKNVILSLRHANCEQSAATVGPKRHFRALRRGKRGVMFFTTKSLSNFETTTK